MKSHVSCDLLEKENKAVVNYLLSNENFLKRVSNSMLTTEDKRRYGAEILQAAVDSAKPEGEAVWEAVDKYLSAWVRDCPKCLRNWLFSIFLDYIMFASRQIVVFVDLLIQYEDRVCGFCETGAPMMRCSRCKTIFYCTEECQKEHWGEHKIKCKRSSVK